MYIQSPDLLRKIASIASAVALKTSNIITFSEYVALPHYGGNIMLRFNLNTESCTAEEFHRYESLIYSISGDEFLKRAETVISSGNKKLDRQLETLLKNSGVVSGTYLINWSSRAGEK